MAWSRESRRNLLTIAHHTGLPRRFVSNENDVKDLLRPRAIEENSFIPGDRP
jgi:hypothetical protein